MIYRKVTKKPSDENEFQIQFLRYCASQKSGFTQKEALEKFPEWKNYLMIVFERREVVEILAQYPNKPSLDWKFAISFEGYFKLIEYDELKLARINAQDARKYSLVAIFISLVALGIGVWQVIAPVKIDKAQSLKFNEAQYNQLLNSIKKVECKLEDNKVGSADCILLELGIEPKK